MNYRDFLKKKAIKTNSATFHNAYRSLRNNINKQIIHAKRNYYTNCIERNKNNSKQMWKNINHLINKRPKSSNIPALEINEQVFVEDSNIANLFNDYFADIGSSLSSQIAESSASFQRYMKFTAQNQFIFKSIHVQDVVNEIGKLNVSKSTGPDNIPAKLLRDSKDVVAPFLALIFNTSLNNCIFPDDLKTARISPIYKSGNKKARGNYRPISVLSVIAKLFEKLICEQLNLFLEENKILSSCQSGFRKGHSTTSALLENTDSWLLNMDTGRINGVLFLHLCKAFDTVDHAILVITGHKITH